MIGSRWDYKVMENKELFIGGVKVARLYRDVNSFGRYTYVLEMLDGVVRIFLDVLTCAIERSTLDCVYLEHGVDLVDKIVNMLNHIPSRPKCGIVVKIKGSPLAASYHNTLLRCGVKSRKEVITVLQDWLGVE